VQCECHDRPLLDWIRARSILAILVVAGLLGVFNLYPDAVRANMAKTHAILQTQRDAPDRPAWLPGHEAGQYSLQWNGETGISEIDPETMQVSPPKPPIIARFENGYELLCVDAVCIPAMRGIIARAP
jgi:hypothetical protein